MIIYNILQCHHDTDGIGFNFKYLWLLISCKIFDSDGSSNVLLQIKKQTLNININLQQITQIKFFCKDYSLY